MSSGNFVATILKAVFASIKLTLKTLLLNEYTDMAASITIYHGDIPSADGQTWIVMLYIRALILNELNLLQSYILDRSLCLKNHRKAEYNKDFVPLI